MLEEADSEQLPLLPFDRTFCLSTSNTWLKSIY